MNIFDEISKFENMFEYVVKDGLKKAKIDIQKGVPIDYFYKYPIYEKDFEKSKMPNFRTTFLLLNGHEQYNDYSSLFRKYVTKNDRRIDIGNLKRNR